jgi:hypothetical protein
MVHINIVTLCFEGLTGAYMNYCTDISRPAGKTYHLLFKSVASTAESNSYIFRSTLVVHFQSHASEHFISEILWLVKQLHYVFQLLSVINCWRLSRENPQLALHHRAGFHISVVASLPLAENKASTEQAVHHLAAHYNKGAYLKTWYNLHIPLKYLWRKKQRFFSPEFS